MTLPIRDVVGILGDNLRLRGSVLPIPDRQATRWTRGLELRRGGETVLYTGQMYQLIPYIERLVSAEQRLGDSPLARHTALGRRANRIVNLAALVAHPSGHERAQYDRVPRNVVRLLRDAGVEFGCMYENDLYSGALAYDLGLDTVVTDHARRVHALLHANGVRTVITIDPHTTHMLRTVYPTLLGTFDITVRNYLEVLAERDDTVECNGIPPAAGTHEFVLHDSCVMARHENIVDPPRTLLARAGLSVREPARSGKLTWCCGGPAESLYPDTALATARTRVDQLRAVSDECVTMCPLCLVNLSKAAGDTIRFRDISDALLATHTSEPEPTATRG